MKNTGIIVDSLGLNDITYELVSSLNNKSDNVSLFYKDFGFSPIVPKFSVAFLKDAYSFNGNLISTSIETTKILKHCVCKQKYFYIWKFEWMQQNTTFQELSEVYLDDKITLLCRSEEHSRKIESIWKKPLVVQDFQLIETL